MVGVWIRKGFRLAAAILLGATFLSAASQPRPRIDWSALRGVNFIPSYARSSEEIWENYDHDAMNRELGFAAGLGFNSVRVFLQYLAYRKNPAKMISSLGDFLNLCARYHLTVMPVLFDSCGLDSRPDSVVMSSRQAYLKFLANPSLSPEAKARLKRVYGPYALGRGQAVPVPIGRTTPGDILLWGWWTPSPGFRLLTERHWPALETYVDAIAGRFRDNPQIVAWEVMNEPETLMDLPPGDTMAEAQVRVHRFLAHFSTYIKNRYPDRPVTIGSGNLESMKKTEPDVNVLSLHVYKPAEQTIEEIDGAKAFASRAGKPLLITECLANTNQWLTIFAEQRLASDEGQLAHYQKILPILMNSHLGWYSWGFIVGHLFGGFTGIIYQNGYRRPAAMYLARTLRSGAPR
ncbi:MAG TPA: cellulase family glycosylhydrolase [Terriglobia bacterium]|nr:cellulase family glycosylhydrolase [Terriglobia bacterium]